MDEASPHFPKCSAVWSRHPSRPGLLRRAECSSLKRPPAGRDRLYPEITHPRLALPTAPVPMERPTTAPPRLGHRRMERPGRSSSAIQSGPLLSADFSWRGEGEAWERLLESWLVFYIYPNPAADPSPHPFPGVPEEARAAVLPVGAGLLFQGPLNLWTAPPSAVPSWYDYYPWFKNWNRRSIFTTAFRNRSHRKCVLFFLPASYSAVYRGLSSPARDQSSEA